ncbi:hypothetical protein NL676_036616 [Syzygium grande]|nr:hypothetical protein NL676_036616 [Syzygium grande]
MFRRDDRELSFPNKKKWAGQRSEPSSPGSLWWRRRRTELWSRHSSKDYWVVVVVMQAVEVEEEITLVAEWATLEATVGLQMEASSQWVTTALVERAEVLTMKILELV